MDLKTLIDKILGEKQTKIQLMRAVKQEAKISDDPVIFYQLTFTANGDGKQSYFIRFKEAFKATRILLKNRKKLQLRQYRYIPWQDKTEVDELSPNALMTYAARPNMPKRRKKPVKIAG